MRYGAMNFPIKPVLEEIEAFAGMGFDFLELSLDAPQAHYSQILLLQDEIRRLLDAHDLGLVCHLPTFVFTADLTDSIRRASLDEMLRSIETAHGLHAEKVVLHPSIISGLGSFVVDLVRQYAVESLQTLLHKAANLEVHLVPGKHVSLLWVFFRGPRLFAASEHASGLENHPRHWARQH